MKTFFKQFKLVALTFVIITGLNSCDAIKNANNKQKGAVIGTAGGAILGAIIGNNVGKKGDGGELGAVIGGVVGGTAGVLIGNKMDKQAQKIETEIPGAKVERIDDSILVTFDEQSGVHFETNLFNITPTSATLLHKLGGILQEYPDTKILVVGHTDSSGTASYNMTLSEKRGYAVTNYFIQNIGLNSSRFTTSWFGESEPVADNSTAEGRAKNRRVNIAIIPNEKMIEDAKKEAANN